jgi:hypothetical protein
MRRLLVVLAAVVIAAPLALADGSGSGSGSGSADPFWGSAGSGSGSGTRKPKKIVIQIPTDVVAPKVSASASPSQVRLGAAFTLFVQAEYTTGVEVNLQEPVDLGGAFEVTKKVSVADRVKPDGTHVREWQLAVFAWELGDLEVPEVGVTFTSMGKAGQVATNGVPIRVLGVLGDVDDPKLLRANAPPQRLIGRDWFWLYVLCGVSGAIIAVGFYLLWRTRVRGRNIALTGGAITVSRRIDMTSERALERLLAIERSGVLGDDDTRKRGFAEMVDVIREYLNLRYRIATLDLTTAELGRSLARVAPQAECEALAIWLEGCDFVKYGGGRTTLAAARTALEDARNLITSTATIRATGASASQSMRRVA